MISSSLCVFVGSLVRMGGARGRSTLTLEKQETPSQKKDEFVKITRGGISAQDDLYPPPDLRLNFTEGSSNSRFKHHSETKSTDLQDHVNSRH
ncbi:hypothetical protein MHYP_G00104750 [Metynnis hypsauchen]